MDEIHPSEASGHLTSLSLVYSRATWDLYDLLDQSLDPRGPDWLLSKAGEFLSHDSRLLDAGCRDAAHLIRLVQMYSAEGVGFDPLPTHLRRANLAVAAAGLEGRVSVVQATMENCPLPDESFDFIWCRDVLEQVEPLVPSIRGITRVLRRGGRMLVYTNVVTDQLGPDDAKILGHHLGNVGDNLVEGNLQDAFHSAGLTVEEKEDIGTEWREFLEEEGKGISVSLLRLARLRRRRESVTSLYGEDVYRHVEANLHWEVFQFLGKLKPLVYVLRRSSER